MTTSNTITKNDLASVLDNVLPIQGTDLTQAGVNAFVNNLNIDGSGVHSVRVAKIGEVVCYAGTDVPAGWLKCDGSAVSRTDYSALYSVIGTTYGSGDGSTTFNLPDLRDRFPVGAGTTYSVGSTGGEATVTLDISKIPSHDGHAIGNDYYGGVSAGQTTYFLPNTSAGAYGNDRPYIVKNGNELAMRSISRGGGEAHNNMPPYMGMNYIIYTGKDIIQIETTNFMGVFYPVGSYYETSDTTFNPNLTWGGTWTLEHNNTIVTNSQSPATFTAGTYTNVCSVTLNANSKYLVVGSIAHGQSAAITTAIDFTRVSGTSSVWFSNKNWATTASAGGALNATLYVETTTECVVAVTTYNYTSSNITTGYGQIVAIPLDNVDGRYVWHRTA